MKSLIHHTNNALQVIKFIQEIQLISKLDSPYIVKFVGVSWSHPSDLQLVTEFIDGGDLRVNLEKNKKGSFSWKFKVKCACQVAQALAYLHTRNPSIIHRDLKSRNVLLTSTKDAKLTDFGISRENTTNTLTAGIGTYRWMAPEVLNDDSYSEFADIYSFGVVMTELSNEIVPYSDVFNSVGKPLPDTALMAKVMCGDLRPTFAANTPQWFIDLGTQCLLHDQKERPTAFDLVHQFEQQLSEL
ncbi:kinase [Thraustotheca clavata]|uniref:Kinase n=1 Tax=Thraustotheca clavata TaxID=74557 RepID=A0A1V9Y476_9STRA|nr:kinase [Thraustotheca clavata]